MSMTSFISWTGNKAKWVHQLLEHIPGEFRYYHEPFLGSGSFGLSLLLNKGYLISKVFLSDINCELVNTWKMVRDFPKPLICSVLKRVFKDSFEYFDMLRRQDAFSLDSSIRRASRFLYLNKASYPSGLWRENQSGEYNTAYGGIKSDTVFGDKWQETVVNVSDLLRSSKRRKVSLYCEHYKNVLKRAKGSDDFVYFDPPYWVKVSSKAFTQYHHSGFGVEDQKELLNVWKELDKRGCKLMMTNSNIPEVWKHYRNNNKNNNVIKGLSKTEVLIKNY